MNNDPNNEPKPEDWVNWPMSEVLKHPWIKNLERARDREFWRGLRTGAVLAVIVIGGVFLIWASLAGTGR